MYIEKRRTGLAYLSLKISHHFAQNTEFKFFEVQEIAGKFFIVLDFTVTVKP